MSVKTITKPVTVKSGPAKTGHAKTSMAVAAAMTLAVATAATAPSPASAAEMEKCYGVAKAGMNDCQTANGSCAGTSKMDRQNDAFITVPEGTCEKIAGGSLEPKMMK